MSFKRALYVILISISAIFLAVVMLHKKSQEQIVDDIANIIVKESCEDASDQDFARSLADYIQKMSLPWEQHDNVYKEYSKYEAIAKKLASESKDCKIKIFSPPYPTGDANKERAKRNNEESKRLLERAQYYDNLNRQ